MNQAESDHQVMRNELRQLVERKRRQAVLPEYQSKVSDAEVLGMLVAQYFDWSGVDVLETAGAALEDANFHKEAALVRHMGVSL